MNRTIVARLARLERAGDSGDTWYAVGCAETAEEIKAFRDRTGFTGLVILTGVPDREGLHVVGKLVR